MIATVTVCSDLLSSMLSVVYAGSTKADTDIPSKRKPRAGTGLKQDKEQWKCSTGAC